MGSKSSGKIVSTSFPAGETVELYDRQADSLDADTLGKPVATAKVDKYSVVTFSSLDPGRPYWLVHKAKKDEAQAPTVAAFSKNPANPGELPVSRHKIKTPADVRKELAEQARDHNDMSAVVEGARSTVESNPQPKERNEVGDPVGPQSLDTPSSPPWDSREPGSKSARGLSDQGTTPVEDEEDRTPAYRDGTEPPPEQPAGDERGVTDEVSRQVPDGFVEDADGGIRPANRDPDEDTEQPAEAPEDLASTDPDHERKVGEEPVLPPEDESTPAAGTDTRKPKGSSSKKGGLTAAQRSERSRKAAATRKRNAAKAKSSSK